MQSFHVLLVAAVAFCLNHPILVTGAENSWIKPNSGSWEEQAHWSLGVLPDATQSVLFTNAGWKALAIGANTAQNFPQSMRVQSLRVAGPVDSYNTLLVNWTGFEQPLQTTFLTVGPNATVAVHGSVLELLSSTDFDSGRIILNGTFIQSDLSRVKASSLTVVRAGGQGDGTYFLTNGILDVGGIVIAGGYSGRFFQYGGSNNAGGIVLHPLGEYELHGGQITSTNGITVGTGDFADAASFVQYGGSVNANMDVNGRYFLNAGTVAGRMAVPSTTSFDRADSHVSQNGGTNFAISLDMGLHATRRGGYGWYLLSNGVLRVGSSVTIHGGGFSQSNGVHTIVSNLNLQGFAMFGLSSSSAFYFLQDGTLSAGGLFAQAGGFSQAGGTNLIGGDVVLISLPPETTRPLEATSYTLSGGFFSSRNVTLDTFYGGFRQTGGSSQITEKLTVQVQAATNGSTGYTLAGGTLTVKDIEIGPDAFFQHTNGNIIHSGVLTLRKGTWYAAPGIHALGPLQLTGAQTNRISFPSASSVLRLANSSVTPWTSGAMLYINNWHGSVSGGGATQIYFGSNANALTPQQLAQIRFDISNNLYPARLLATGEVVPDMQPFTVSRSSNTLTLNWQSGWTLQSSTNIAGPFEDVQGAVSPYSPSMSGPRRFFRLRQ